MTHEEKRAWIRLVVAVFAYAAYVTVVVGRADGRSLPDVPYASALLWTVGAAIAASIVVDLCFALSAVLGGITKVIVYRKSLPEW